MKQLDATDIPVQPRSTGCPVPLTALQLRLWNNVLKRGTRLSELRMCAASVRLLGPLDTCLLTRSIGAIVQRHESLRTRFVAADGTPRQHIEVAFEYDLKVLDLAGLSSPDVEREARHLAEEFVKEKVDVSVGPLFEARLLKLSDHQHVLILALDHMISDAISCGILSREIWTLYHQAAQGVPLSLSPLPVQFADYAVWQQHTYSAWLKKHESYWRGRLTGAPGIQFPLDVCLTEVRRPTWEKLHFPLGPHLSAKLRDVARSERVLLPLVVFAVYVAAMSRWCNQRDLVLAFVSHGRHRRPELQKMIGFIAGFLYFRIELAKEDNFLDVLKRVNLEFYSAYQHQDFDRVPDLISECTGLYFNWIPTNWIQRSVDQKEEADSRLKIQPFPIQPVRSRVVDASLFQFAAIFSDTPAGIVMAVGYRSDLFAKSTVERFVDNFRLLAAEFARHPLASVASAALAL